MSRDIAARICVSLIAVASLAGCGFQLRGGATVDPALSPMRIESVRPGSPLLPPLRRALTNAGVAVAAPGDAAAVVLRIVAEESGERVIALSAQGRPREVELTYLVEFEVSDGAHALIERRELLLAREFAVNERDILGKSHEADVLRGALLHDMVSALVRQVAAAQPR